MSKVSTCILVWTLVLAVVVLHCYGQSDANPRGSRRRFRNRNRNANANGNGNEGLPPELNNLYQQAIDSDTTTQSVTQGDTTTQSVTQGGRGVGWERFTPRMPAPNEVDCQVEVIRTDTIGGRCTRLGGELGYPICQSGGTFKFDPVCEQVIANRHPSEDDPDKR